MNLVRFYRKTKITNEIEWYKHYRNTPLSRLLCCVNVLLAYCRVEMNFFSFVFYVYFSYFSIALGIWSSRYIWFNQWVAFTIKSLRFINSKFNLIKLIMFSLKSSWVLIVLILILVWLFWLNCIIFNWFHKYLWIFHDFDYKLLNILIYEESTSLWMML